MFKCKFCQRECKNHNSLINHERFCMSNPERTNSPFQDKEKHKEILRIKKVKGRENQWSNPNYKMSEETRLKISNAARGRKHTQETKNKLSVYAKERGLGGVTQSRWIDYNGKKLGSSYELELAKSLDENNINWETCSKIKYIDPNGKERSYTPDFYLPKYNVYLDPKNDFLINENNPSLGFSDVEKIKLVAEQNNITILILNKHQLSWNSIKDLLL